MKFKEWFSIKAIKSEAKQVSWLSKKELVKNSFTVLVFCFVMALFFYAGDAIIALILKALGTN
ncbi:preprotein translocase subunit SecE [Tannockella kyphosi]|uniref:preprotein translocase subunit SecE n=1 Tax=Tannockella kyphosi TaxID=2899121 RepID=UPI002012CF13|nr:preprotein translocase subunit SecE [Tannockella kyphosi]